MAKFSGPSVIPGAQPTMPTEGKVSDFAEILATPVPEQAVTPEPTTAPEVAAPAILTQPITEVATEAQMPAIDMPEAPTPAPDLVAEQRERERVPAYTEKLKRTTLAPSAVQNTQPLESALVRADNTTAVMAEEVGGSKMTAKKLETLQAGFPEAAFSATDPEGNIKVPVAPALRGSTINVGVQSLLYDPRMLDAGKYDEETGRMSIDPDFGRVMSLTTEAWMHQQMDAATEMAGKIDEETGMPGDYVPGQQGGQRFTKATGNQGLGREIFMAYKRQRAVNEGRPTDDYLQNIDEISPETFIFLGDLAKETYARANPDMVYRDTREVDSGGQVYYQMTPEGAIELDRLNQDFKGLMAQPEVKPLKGVSETAQPVFEGRMRVRPVTTKVGDLKDWSLVQESMANYHSVPYVNDAGRERLAFMFGVLGLINTNNPDNQTYAGMYGIGLDKLNELEGEKQRMMDAAMRIPFPDAREAAIREAQAYNPQKILQANREKFLNIAGAAAEYSNEVNHLTFSMQALTGRTHVQQTLYNPAAHKFLRFIVGGGNVYKWKPNTGGEVEAAWKEIISGLLLSAEKDGKVFKGTELSTQERLATFDRTIGNDQWNQFVAWGNQLKQARDNFDINGAKQAVEAIRKAQSPDAVRGIKQDIVKRFSNDPLDANLKAELAKHGDEGPMFANLFIEVANYDAARKDGAQFSTTITAEMDGKTHGPATNAAILGVSSMAKRTGLIVTQDFSNTDWLDSRKAMGENMQATVGTYAGTLYPANQISYFTNILNLAIKDRANFLKKSPMTMGYGQEIPSLKQHVETTVYSGPSADAIKKEAVAGEISLDDTVDFLHTMLVDSIFEIMDPKVVAMGRLLKANAVMSMASNEVLYFDNAMGFRSYAAGKQMAPELTTSSSFEFKDQEGGRKKVAVQFYKERAEGSAERPELGPGGWTLGRIIPVSVQSYDGNMIARTGSGQSWERISQAAKGKPFVLPIFDAFVTDLGSFAAVRREANKNWFEGIRDHSYVEEVAGTWFDDTMKKIAAPLPDPNEKVNLDEDGPYRGLAYLLSRTKQGDLVLSKFLAKTLQHKAKTPGTSIDQYTAQLQIAGEEAAVQFENDLADMGIDVDNTVFTKRQIQRILMTLKNTMNLSQRNKQAVAVTAKDKREVLSQVDKNLTQMDL